ncbi:hypothetical protein FRAHR75_930008 [Frankia sp. Hr75.2]|nr:hypothetical protein FRAHR75_930008 [Frankia sp. Hr75.2]
MGVGETTGAPGTPAERDGPEPGRSDRGRPDRGRLDKRRAIVEAALRVFSRHGYTEATIDMIATEAGVAKPTIYNHLGRRRTCSGTS